MPMPSHATLLLAAAFASAFPVAATITPAQPAAEAAPADAPSSVLDHARTLPELPVRDGAVTIPLHGADPMPWRPIREGVAVTGGKALKVAYTRTRGQPAGAALVVRPGALTDLQSISLSISGNRPHTLFLNLKQSDGSVWTLGPISVQPGAPREVVLRAEDVELDPYQNRGRGPATFNPAEVYMLTLLDISGYMSPAEPQCDWTVSSMKAVRP